MCLEKLMICIRKKNYYFNDHTVIFFLNDVSNKYTSTFKKAMYNYFDYFVNYSAIYYF